MDPETLNVMNESLYHWVLMLIQCITLIVGAASILFILVAPVCAVCGFFAEKGQSARRQMKPEPPEPDAHELLAALAGLDEGLDDSFARRELSSIEQA